MNFRHPYWRLLFISFGCLVLGFAVWMIVTPDFKAEPDWRLWVWGIAYFLIPLGAIGFISSLIWMLGAGFRKH